MTFNLSTHLYDECPVRSLVLTNEMLMRSGFVTFCELMFCQIAIPLVHFSAAKGNLPSALENNYPFYTVNRDYSFSATF